MSLASVLSDHARRPSRLQLAVSTAAAVLVASVVVGFGARSLPPNYLLMVVGGAVLVIVALRDMRAALTLTVLSADTIPLSIGTGTHSAVNAAMALVALFTGLWMLRMVASRRIHLALPPLNAPLLAFLVAAWQLASEHCVRMEAWGPRRT